LLLIAVAIVGPPLAGSAQLAEDWTRQTVRVALAYYAVAAFVMLGLSRGDWAGPRGQTVRLTWSLAWAAYIVHLGFAAEYHGYSHAAAIEHTAQRTGGYGHGIFVSHLFTLIWTLDLLWWWRSPRSYADRPLALGIAGHAFAAFLWFNATVVYETGLIRAVGLATFAVLGLRLLVRVYSGWSRNGPTTDSSAVAHRA
jgi:hypothetical protein